MLIGTSAGIRPLLRPRQSLGTELHVYHVVYLIFDLHMCGLLPTVPNLATRAALVYSYVPAPNALAY